MSPYPHEQTSLIGIAVAIGGNILISFALNCQKLAHKYLETERSKHSNDPPNRQLDDEEQPLIPSAAQDDTTLINYGSNTDSASPLSVSTRIERRYVTNRSYTSSEASLEELGETNHRSAHHTNKSPPPGSSLNIEGEAQGKGKETDYLRSKLWSVFIHHYHYSYFIFKFVLRWSGFLLMNIGELGNFLSYAYAPASVVAPLGTVRDYFPVIFFLFITFV